MKRVVVVRRRKEKKEEGTPFVVQSSIISWVSIKRKRVYVDQSQVFFIVFNSVQTERTSHLNEYNVHIVCSVGTLPSILMSVYVLRLIPIIESSSFRIFDKLLKDFIFIIICLSSIFPFDPFYIERELKITS